MRRLGAVVFIASFVASLGWHTAHGHDIYQGLRAPGSGQLCCGGDPVTGDCEAVTYDQLKVNVDGTATFQSRRYGVSVLVAAEKITWLPVDDQPGHWCGRPKGTYAYEGKDQIDPAFWTFCAFISPGGV